MGGLIHSRVLSRSSQIFSGYTPPPWRQDMPVVIAGWEGDTAELQRGRRGIYVATPTTINIEKKLSTGIDDPLFKGKKYSLFFRGVFFFSVNPHPCPSSAALSILSHALCENLSNRLANQIAEI